MQKRSKYRILFEPVHLPADCPALTGPDFIQKDRSIVYLHRHNVWEFGYCFRGCGVFLIGENSFGFSAGNAVYIPPGMPHLAQSSPGSVSIWRWTYVDFPGVLCRPFPELDLSFLKQLSCGVAAAGSELSGALHLLQNSASRAEERVAGTVFLLSALRNLPGTRSERAPAELPGDFERIAPALRFLSRHSCDSICFHDLGSRCGMSPANFRKLFFRTLHASPREYAASLRLTHAKVLLLQSRQSIGEIALACGYRTLSCFNRKFRAETGLSPRDFRKNGMPGISCG